jgi:heavy metal efflux system protein
LATVVIGGLITATVLTLLVLPCIYMSVAKKVEAKTGDTSLSTLQNPTND